MGLSVRTSLRLTSAHRFVRDYCVLPLLNFVAGQAPGLSAVRSILCFMFQKGDLSIRVIVVILTINARRNLLDVSSSQSVNSKVVILE